MSIVGGVIGFFVGIPFGNLLIKSVSEKMILGNDSGLVLNLIGSLQSEADRRGSVTRRRVCIPLENHILEMPSLWH